MEYVIHISKKGGEFFAYHSTKDTSELDRLVAKYLSMRGITIEVKKRNLS